MHPAFKPVQGDVKKRTRLAELVLLKSKESIEIVSRERLINRLTLNVCAEFNHCCFYCKRNIWTKVVAELRYLNLLSKCNNQIFLLQ